MNAQEFEQACNDQIGGWIWDESFNADYQESVTLTIKEMRQISNLIRSANGIKQGAVQEWNEEKESETLKPDVEKPAFTCFKCGDGNTPLYCLNCAETIQNQE